MNRLGLIVILALSVEFTDWPKCAEREDAVYVERESDNGMCPKSLIKLANA